MEFSEEAVRKSVEVQVNRIIRVKTIFTLTGTLIARTLQSPKPGVRPRNYG